MRYRRGMGASLIMLTTTVDRQDAARRLAHGLVEQGLAACAQVSSPLASVYRWRGTVEEAREWAVVVKTTRERLDAALAWLEREHPYEVPELVWWEIAAAPAYHDWAVGAVEEGR